LESHSEAKYQLSHIFAKAKYERELRRVWDLPPYKQGCIVISSFGDTFSHRWLVSRIFAVPQWWRCCQLWLNMQPPPQQQQHAQQQHHKPRSNISSCNGNCKQTSEKTLTHSNLKGVFNCVNLTPFMAHQTRTICTPLQYHWNPLFSPSKTPFLDPLPRHIAAARWAY